MRFFVRAFTWSSMSSSCSSSCWSSNSSSSLPSLPSSISLAVRPRSLLLYKLQPYNSKRLHRRKLIVTFYSCIAMVRFKIPRQTLERMVARQSFPELSSKNSFNALHQSCRELGASTKKLSSS